MAISSNKPIKWKEDIAASVDLFNTWFMKFAPSAYKNTRSKTATTVIEAMKLTKDLRILSPKVLQQYPAILSTLRMSTSPPLARDRLVGLAYANKNLVFKMEAGSLPPRIGQEELCRDLNSICNIIQRLLDRDIFPWLEGKEEPTEQERQRASTIVADRLCGAVADPIIRNAQEQRQLALIGNYLKSKGYKQKTHPKELPLNKMEPGTFTFRLNVAVGKQRKLNIPIDVVIQPKKPRKSGIPILIEAKSAGDFTNTNKRRKEEATKIHQLRGTYGKDASLILFLCGYLGYEAAEGLDWIWEHRIDDLMKLGL